MNTPWSSPEPGVPLLKAEELDAMRRAFSSLTSRQRQVVMLLGDGARPAEVARELGVTRTTVSFHVRRIVQKLGLHSRRELAKAAVLLARAAGDTEPHPPEGPS
jgi:DNA-binding NarL/FixJ family response regulator